MPHFAKKNWAEIQRLQTGSPERLLEDLEEFVKRGEPVVLRHAAVVDSQVWTNEYLEKTFGDKLLRVKRSNCNKFRYFAADRNHGNFPFRAPLEETQMKFADFLAEAWRLSEAGSASRLYCQERMSSHGAMTDEFNTSWLVKTPSISIFAVINI